MVTARRRAHAGTAHSESPSAKRGVSVRMAPGAHTSHVLHETAHEVRMNCGLFSHSPACAHDLQLASESTHSSSSPSAPPLAVALAAALSSRALIVAHVLQLRAHETDMYSGFDSHSPWAAQLAHSPDESKHVGSTSSGSSAPGPGMRVSSVAERASAAASLSAEKMRSISASPRRW